MIELFKPEDFPSGENGEEASAEIANAKLNAYIQCEDKFYGDIKLGGYHGKPLLWSVDEQPNSTHTCRIIDVKRIQRG